MPVLPNQLRLVHAIESRASEETRTDCPICLMPLQEEMCTKDRQEDASSKNDTLSNDAEDVRDHKVQEMLNHGFCRTTFHACCVQQWLEQSCLCPWCRSCILFHNHHGGRDAPEQRLHTDMIELTGRRLASSGQWSQYWEQRLVRHNEIGTELFNQQPGYVVQQEFRDRILLARVEQTQLLNRAIRIFCQAEIAENTAEENNTADEPMSSLVPCTQFTPQLASDTTEVERRHREAEIVAQWNLFAARNVSGARPSEQFERAWGESTARFQAVVRGARTILEDEREMDEQRETWQDDPPNPF